MNINKAIKEELEKLILEQNRQRDVSAAPNRKNTLSNEEIQRIMRDTNMWERGMPGFYLPIVRPGDDPNRPKFWIYAGESAYEGGTTKSVPVRRDVYKLIKRFQADHSRRHGPYIDMVKRALDKSGRTTFGSHDKVSYGYIPKSRRPLAMGDEGLTPKQLSHDPVVTSYGGEEEKEAWQGFSKPAQGPWHTAWTQMFQKPGDPTGEPLVRSWRDPKTGEWHQTQIINVSPREKQVGGRLRRTEVEHSPERAREIASKPYEALRDRQRQFEREKAFPGPAGFRDLDLKGPFTWPYKWGISDIVGPLTGVDLENKARNQAAQSLYGLNYDELSDASKNSEDLQYEIANTWKRWGPALGSSYKPADPLLTSAQGDYQMGALDFLDLATLPFLPMAARQGIRSLGQLGKSPVLKFLDSKAAELAKRLRRNRLPYTPPPPEGTRYITTLPSGEMIYQPIKEVLNKIIKEELEKFLQEKTITPSAMQTCRDGTRREAGTCPRPNIVYRRPKAPKIRAPKGYKHPPKEPEELIDEQTSGDIPYRGRKGKPRVPYRTPGPKPVTRKDIENFRKAKEKGITSKDIKRRLRTKTKKEKEQERRERAIEKKGGGPVQDPRTLPRGPMPIPKHLKDPHAVPRRVTEKQNP